MNSKILLTGASGYLGQHLLWHWMTNGISLDAAGNNGDIISYTVVAVYNQSPGFAPAVQEALQKLSSLSSPSKVEVIPVSCDLTKSAAVDSFLERHRFHACVHTAALSSPRACEQDPENAKRINVPEYFFQKLSGVRLIIALSTDQVYDGTKDTATHGWYKEDADVPKPLNVYGQTKLDMELYLKDRTKTDGIILLRSSIILGPKAPLTKAHDTFLHFCASRTGQETTTFFTNEYRTVVSVTHACRVIQYFLQDATSTAAAAAAAAGVYHLGGPIRVNRLDMAQAVVACLGSDPQMVLPAEQTSPTSPLDISMDSSLLERVTGIIHEPNTLRGLVELTLNNVQ